jgi:hypothetical protein
MPSFMATYTNMILNDVSKTNASSSTIRKGNLKRSLPVLLLLKA